jgi:hypothetical protein
MDVELEELRAEAEAAGIDVDRRWGKDRLRKEIDAVKPEPEVEAEPMSELEAWQAAERGEHHPPDDDNREPDEDELLDALIDELDEPGPPPENTPGVHRAGGHVERGDGRGWMPEMNDEG